MTEPESEPIFPDYKPMLFYLPSSLGKEYVSTYKQAGTWDFSTIWGALGEKNKLPSEITRKAKI